MRLHDLRHTGLTLAAATGATTAELMHRAGHSRLPQRCAINTRPATVTEFSQTHLNHLLSRLRSSHFFVSHKRQLLTELTRVLQILSWR